MSSTTLVPPNLASSTSAGIPVDTGGILLVRARHFERAGGGVHLVLLVALALVSGLDPTRPSRESDPIWFHSWANWRAIRPQSRSCRSLGGLFRHVEHEDSYPDSKAQMPNCPSASICNARSRIVAMSFAKSLAQFLTGRDKVVLDAHASS